MMIQMMTSGRGSVASSEYCNAILRGIDMLVHHCRAVVADSIHRRRRPSLIQHGSGWSRSCAGWWPAPVPSNASSTPCAAAAPNPRCACIR